MSDAEARALRYGDLICRIVEPCALSDGRGRDLFVVHHLRGDGGAHVCIVTTGSLTFASGEVARVRWDERRS